MDKEKKELQFIAIDKAIESNIVLPTESEVRNQDFIEWGVNNMYPSYLNDLYDNVPTLQSIINALTDYVSGDEVISHIPTISNNTLTKLVKAMVLEYGIYGGFALNVMKNTFGKPVGIELLDLRKVRSDKDNNNFYYTDDFCKKSYGRCKYLLYPKFTHNSGKENSIYFYKNSHFKTYPTPLYASAVVSCEVERSINEFHLNSINNGLFAGFLVNFNNGTPSDEMRQEIEDNFNEKFSGKDNAGRMIISFNDSKDNAVTIDELKVEDYGQKYITLAKRCRQEIFTAFRCNPNLMGINTENNGFAQEDFENSFKLFNKTVITPIQNTIVDSINDIFGEGSIEIKPFTIDWENNKEEENTID